MTSSGPLQKGVYSSIESGGDVGLPATAAREQTFRDRRFGQFPDIAPIPAQRAKGCDIVMPQPQNLLVFYITVPVVDCRRVTGGGFHLPVSASDFGA